MPALWPEEDVSAEKFTSTEWVVTSDSWVPKLRY
jgi:hypothetical protein